MAIGTGNQTDGQLLERFAGQRDEEAFAQLVRRHGPMVLGVCRQILRHEQDAEDAFQATFLVLARKAGSIRRAEALPNWLYGVANRLAKRMRMLAMRRLTHEVALVDTAASKGGPGIEVDDLGPVLHEEIGRLPDKYRVPFVLCYLNGQSNEEAARRLGCPTGTVFSRLARARERLRSRLTRRGLALSSGILVTSLASLSQPASAAVPPVLISTTVNHGLRFGSGQLGATVDLPAHIRDLAEWGLKSFSVGWLRITAALLVIIAVGGVVGTLLLRPRANEVPIAQRLQGAWVLDSMIQAGSARTGAEGRLTLDGTHMVLQTSAFDSSGTYRIDVAADPKRIDWTVSGATLHGIFELQGKQLTICITLAAAGRPATEPPTDFNPRVDRSVMVFERSPH